MQFWAKSNPEQTVQEHTDELLKQLKIFIRLYPEITREWDIQSLLYMVCLYHDIGKINPEFQNKIRGGAQLQQVPHGIYSLCFIDFKKCYKKIRDKYNSSGVENPDKKAKIYIKILGNSIAYHHERDIPEDYETVISQNLDIMKHNFELFDYDKIEKNDVKLIQRQIFYRGTRIMPNKDSEFYYTYVFIKGMLNRIDYAASAGIAVEKKNDFLIEKLNEMMQEWKKNNPVSKWNELQEYTFNNREKNIIAIAQTGMGKTEAGLLWIGDTKGFFILPLKTAINAIYDRVKNGIIHDKTEERVGLLHSETREIYIQEEIKNSENINLDEYYESTKQLSLPLTICTLDQIFDFVYRYKGFEPKLATLKYSKIVLDEIQMYAPELLAYVIKGLQYITEIGGKFCILTATFPAIIGDILKQKGIKFEISRNFTKKDLPLRHNVKVLEKLIDTDDIIGKYEKNKILVICNTVKEAQRIYDELIEKIDDSSKLNMFHSKFTKSDRRVKEKAILKIGNKKSNDYGIWIATQVVEASLDIDFDLLFTELSDLNGLFQRMGRCYRNRPLEKEDANCYVYVGDEKNKNSGVGTFIDKEIYFLSRKMIIENMNGKITENEKMEFIANLYTSENMLKTKYYKKVMKTIEYLEAIDPYEKESADIKREFRNILSYPIIPKLVFEKNLEEIRKHLEKINEKYSFDKDIRNRQRIEKIKAKMAIREYSLNIQDYEFTGSNKDINLSAFDKIELGKYEYIYIVDCYYDFDTGFKVKKNLGNKKEEDTFI